MANITYNPVPDVTPTVGGTGAQYQSADGATPNAFGAGIGQAIQGVGEQVQKQAEHFQNIYAESTARDATTKTAVDMANEQARFFQLKGNDAVNGFKDHQDRLNQIVKDNSDGLSINANEMYQRDSASLVNNAVFKAGAHVGEQAEQAHLGSLKGSIEVNSNLYAQNADNPTGQSYFNAALHAAGEHATASGLDGDPKVAYMTATSGQILASAIKARVQSDPDGAQRLFDSAKGSFNYEDIDKNGNKVTYAIPRMDAAQLAQTTAEMQGEFKRQAQNTLWDAGSFASAGEAYDKPAVAGSMLRAGYTQKDVDAHIGHLDNVQENFGSANARYDVGKLLSNNQALAFSGKAPLDVDESTLRKAYPKDPDRVQDILDQNNQLNRVASFVGGMSTRTLAENQSELDKFKPSGISIADAIHQQESGGRQNAPANGISVGGWQITPDTFKQYAKQGEDINNPKDNEAVGRRIIADLSEKSGGDPARVAVGYFSGSGNIAPAGSPTPWINDTKDANGKHVSSYVSDISGRMAGSNFGEQSDLYAKMQQASQQYYNQLHSDPAGTITGGDVKLNAMYQDAATDVKNPQKMNDYVNEVAKRQEALGIPEENRSVLPKNYSTAIVNGLIKNPEQAPEQLAAMAKTYGSNWPAVYKSLDLPFMYQYIEHAGENPETAIYGSMAAKLGSDEETKGKTDEFIMGGKDGLKGLKDSVKGNDDLKSFMLSMHTSGASPDQLRQIQDTAEHVAMAIHYYDSSSGSIADAVDKAVSSMTHGYGYLPMGGARVPLDKVGAISSNIDSVISKLEDRISPAQYVPATYADRQHYITDLKVNPTWATDEANQRLMMYDHFGKPVMGMDGKQISVGFNDTSNYKPIDTSFIGGLKAISPHGGE